MIATRLEPFRFSSFGLVRKLLIISCVFIPFTELRFGMFGIGELFLGFAFLLLIYTTHFRLRFYRGQKIFLNFWALFICTCIVGFLYNYFMLGHTSGTIKGAVFDLTAYLTVLLFFLIVGERRIFGSGGPVWFCFLVYCIWFGIFLFLYCVSFYSPSVFGLRLLSDGMNFSPLASNIHQTAMLFCSLPFLGLYLLTVHKNILGRLWVAASIPMYAIMALESGSTKALIALVFGTCVIVMWFFGYRTKGKNRAYVNLITCLLFLSALLLILCTYGEQIAASSIAFFRAEDRGQGREIMYLYSINHALDSFIVGYGPGSHAVYFEGRYSDAHNTVLTVFLQGGAIGVILLVTFVVRFIKVVFSSAALMAFFAAISIYVIGGDILRRVPIWIVMYFALVLADSSQSRSRSDVSPRPV